MKGWGVGRRRDGFSGRRFWVEEWVDLSLIFSFLSLFPSLSFLSLSFLFPSPSLSPSSVSQFPSAVVEEGAS